MGFQTFTCCICGKEGLTKRTSYMIEGKGRACREHQEALDANNDREIKREEVAQKNHNQNKFWENRNNNNPADLRCLHRGVKNISFIKNIEMYNTEYQVIKEVCGPMLKDKFEDNCLHSIITLVVEKYLHKLQEKKCHDDVLRIIGQYGYDIVFSGSNTTTCTSWCGSINAKEDFKFFADWINWYLSIPTDGKIRQMCERFIITATKLFELFYNAMVMNVKSDCEITKEQTLHASTIYGNALSDMGGMFSSIYDEMNIKDRIDKTQDTFVTKTIRNISFIKQEFLNGDMDVNELFDVFKCTFADYVNWVRKHEAYAGMIIINHDKIVAKMDAYQKVVTTTNSTPREIRLKYMELLKF